MKWASGRVCARACVHARMCVCVHSRDRRQLGQYKDMEMGDRVPHVADKREGLSG